MPINLLSCASCENHCHIWGCIIIAPRMQASKCLLVRSSKELSLPSNAQYPVPVQSQPRPFSEPTRAEEKVFSYREISYTGKCHDNDAIPALSPNGEHQHYWMLLKPQIPPIRGPCSFLPPLTRRRRACKPAAVALYLPPKSTDRLSLTKSLVHTVLFNPLPEPWARHATSPLGVERLDSPKSGDAQSN
jgi:hypothetical protein